MNEYMEYLCKGKTREGEWVEGYFILDKNADGTFTPDLIISDTVNVFGYIECLQVDPNTIVRCSGRVDMNGIKIFNRDIIKNYNFETKIYNIGVVTYCRWTNCWNVHFPRKGEDSANIDAVLLSQCYVVEVIGNTYDSYNTYAHYIGKNK